MADPNRGVSSRPNRILMMALSLALMGLVVLVPSGSVVAGPKVPTDPTIEGDELHVTGSIPYLSALKAALTGKRDIPIIRGKRAKAREFPWQVSLVMSFIQDNQQAHFCGGALVAPQWVLTAAHCIDGVNPASIQVLWSEGSIEHGERTDVDRIFPHNRWDPETKENDIALLRLKSPILRAGGPSKIQIISTQRERDLDAGTELVVSGWGVTEKGSTSPELLWADVAYVDRQTCSDPSAYGRRVRDCMLCAGNQDPDGGDSCQGDSGGPLVLEASAPLLVGIVSWGDGCGVTGKPGVYTRTALYRDWMASVMR